MTALDRLGEFVLRPADSRLLGYIRIVIGIAVLALVVETGTILKEMESRSTITLPYVELVPQLPVGHINWLLAIWSIAGLAFLVGWYTTLAGLMLTTVQGYVLLADQQSYSNHIFLLSSIVFLLTLAGAGAAYSLDARWRKEPAVSRGGPVFLLKVQLSVVYAFAALCKINALYMTGAVLSVVLRWDGPLALPAALKDRWILAIMAFASVAIEAFLAVGLWVPRWRKAAVLLGVLLHLGMIATVILPDMLGVVVFAVSSLALYPLYFDSGSRISPSEKCDSHTIDCTKDKMQSSSFAASAAV